MKTNAASFAKNTSENLLRESRGMWLRRNAADGGISLHCNKPRYGVLSRSLHVSRLAIHPARYGFERYL